MRKIISTIMMITLVLGMSIAVPNVAQAEEATEVGTYVDGSYLTTDTESSVEVYPRLRGVYLLKGTGSITVPGNGLVGCYGTTTATTTVSKVAVGVTLERYSNGSWTTVTGWTNTAYNTNFVSLYKGQTVTGGYYYRVTTVNTAASEWSMGVTSGVWVVK